jgi:hypothetical protein
VAFEPYRRIYRAVCRLSRPDSAPTIERLRQEFDDPQVQRLLGELHEAILLSDVRDPAAELENVFKKFRARKTRVRVLGFEDLALVITRRFGKGHVVLIGDTAFAMNKNLEYVGGEPFNGRYDNAHFWRWLISALTDQEDWLPPPKEGPGSQPPADGADSSARGDSESMGASAPPSGQARPMEGAPLGSLPVEEVTP